MFRRLLPAPVLSEAAEGSGGEAAPAPAVAAIDTGLEGGSALSGMNADSVASADTVQAADTIDSGDKDKIDEPAELSPDDYKLDLPEGLPRDNPLLQAFLKGAAKGGMDNESVSAAISELAPMVAEMQTAPLQAWQSMNAEWAAAVKADKEMGGANYEKTVATVGAAARLVGSPAEITDFVQALEMTGAGNHPAVVRMLHRMSVRLVEGGHVTGAVAAQRTMSAAERMYPTHNGAASANT